MHQNLDERRKWYRVRDAPLRVPTIIVIRRDTQRGVRRNLRFDAVAGVREVGYWEMIRKPKFCANFVSRVKFGVSEPKAYNLTYHVTSVSV